MFFKRVKKILENISFTEKVKCVFYNIRHKTYAPSQVLMENLEEVYFLLDSNGIIQNKSNLATFELFKCETYKKYFHDVLPVSNDEKKLLIDWYKLIFDSTRNFSDLSQLAPKHVSTPYKKHLKIKYRPVYCTENKVSWIICSVTNQTAILNLKSKRREEQNYSKMIKLLLKNQEGFKTFIEETPTHLDSLKSQLKKSEPNYKRILKDIHTLKGTSASYFFISVSSALRELENLVAKRRDTQIQDVDSINSKLQSIEKTFRDFVEENDDIFSYTLSMVHDGKFIPKEQMLEFLAMLDKQIPIDSELYQYFLQNFVLENVSSVFSKYRCVVESIADAQEKKINYIVKSCNILVYFPYYHDLYQSLIHVIRNAIDHGIETIKEREFLKKTDPAHIMVSFNKIVRENLDYLQIIISDNGRGVKRSDLRALATQMGLQINDEDIFSLVFKHGLTTKKTESDLSGKGIGLSIVKEKVENLGGKVQFHSIENEGSTLTITLPLIRSIKNPSDDQKLVA